jgi:hypothetical protein
LQNVRKTHLCTRPAGREIDRTSTRKALKKITNAIKKTRNYTERDKINEHIFGTIKRQWGYNHTNLTGLEKKWEHSLIMLVYNIKRSINILGVSDLIAKLKKWNSPTKQQLVLSL